MYVSVGVRQALSTIASSVAACMPCNQEEFVVACTLRRRNVLCIKRNLFRCQDICASDLNRKLQPFFPVAKLDASLVRDPVFAQILGGVYYIVALLHFDRA